MTAGRPKGQKKSGGAQKGSVHLHSQAVKNAVYEVFHGLGGKRYLKKIAEENPPLFLSLLAKLLPTEVKAELDVKVQRFDLGAAMIEAEARALEMQTVEALPPIIENAPAPASPSVDENNV